MRAALHYCRAKGFKSAHLWTFDELAGALALYRRHGLEITQRRTARLWGRERTELHMELRLA
jgi:hypothetical protein